MLSVIVLSLSDRFWFVFVGVGVVRTNKRECCRGRSDGAMSGVSLVRKRDATVLIRLGSVDSPLVGEPMECLVKAVVGQQGQATTIVRR